MPPPVSSRRRRRIWPPPNRPHQQRLRTTQRSSLGQEWWNRLGHISPLLLLFGVLLYGTLSLAYLRFYSPLGVDPSDVGLGYAGVLASATGYIASFLLLLSMAVLAVILILVVAIFVWDRFKHKIPKDLIEELEELTDDIDIPWNKIAGWALTAVLVMGLILGPLSLGDGVGEAAAAVREGRPIATQTAIIGVAPLNLRADPVQVLAAGKPDNSPAVKELTKVKDLLYLGQSNGMAVLYDHTQGRAVYLPARTVVLEIDTCRIKSDNPQCADAYRG